MTMLLDDSRGTGAVSRELPPPPEEHDVGYAGGIGPSNIDEMLERVSRAAAGRTTWIDMESSLRTKLSSTEDGDIFDINKCFSVIDAVVKRGIHTQSNFLLPDEHGHGHESGHPNAETNKSKR
mmetsp:Transcript_35428/g.82168  ORF Transcript_35428/g.82168 Transcript_35428/m.82168 type:complete len:123 (-) Transcript_35428:324-692(-)